MSTESNYKTKLKQLSLQEDECKTYLEMKPEFKICQTCTPNPNAVVEIERNREVNVPIYDPRTCEYVIVVDEAVDFNGNVVQYENYTDLSDNAGSVERGLLQYIRPAIRRMLQHYGKQVSDKSILNEETILNDEE